MKIADRRVGRVVESHRLASYAFRLAGGFGLLALGWTLWVIWNGGSWWGPLHAFLAGAVILAISGASQMFTVTWSAAPAPGRTVTTGQRWAVTVGVAAVLVGVSNGWAAVAGVGA